MRASPNSQRLVAHYRLMRSHQPLTIDFSQHYQDAPIDRDSGVGCLVHPYTISEVSRVILRHGLYEVDVPASFDAPFPVSLNLLPPVRQDVCREIVGVFRVQPRDPCRIPSVIESDPVLRHLSDVRLVAHRSLARFGLWDGRLRHGGIRAFLIDSFAVFLLPRQRRLSGIGHLHGSAIFRCRLSCENLLNWKTILPRGHEAAEY